MTYSKQKEVYKDLAYSLEKVRWYADYIAKASGEPQVQHCVEIGYLLQMVEWEYNYLFKLILSASYEERLSDER